MRWPTTSAGQGKQGTNGKDWKKEEKAPIKMAGPATSEDQILIRTDAKRSTMHDSLFPQLDPPCGPPFRQRKRFCDTGTTITSGKENSRYFRN
ncbi:MAG: hypothetical protein A3B23_00465 [Candidatus Colwellbacteria bacterium RIFCSPLOWO2_01_FULL_48_10]|uniref:Uncharacterized protein n=2 Tax=Bacteria candidate phyla TaxID=1783234 RepID=A0A1F5P3Q3_9BACT|nr:MAG: hypothetical protein A2846_04610 [Candidatus Doudnabacteria bacterium RIFCSPHIGHO2_01_FULL_49_9]OGY59178.1 MAG: hypothetical protein A3B23_00465 [Candidatus Colwellbacteria bacterium RIFCSPLOWO2_01_FULL_48_10]